MRGMQFWSDTAKNVLDLWGDGALRNFRKALEAHRGRQLLSLSFPCKNLELLCNKLLKLI